jgi:hypothetical protein
MGRIVPMWHACSKGYDDTMILTLLTHHKTDTNILVKNEWNNRSLRKWKNTGLKNRVMKAVSPRTEAIKILSELNFCYRRKFQKELKSLPIPRSIKVISEESDEADFIIRPTKRKASEISETKDFAASDEVATVDDSAASGEVAIVDDSTVSDEVATVDNSAVSVTVATVDESYDSDQQSSTKADNSTSPSW